jgi:hypothetical protein
MDLKKEEVSGMKQITQSGASLFELIIYYYQLHGLKSVISVVDYFCQ